MKFVNKDATIKIKREECWLGAGGLCDSGLKITIRELSRIKELF
jgi:hypothetical protein